MDPISLVKEWNWYTNWFLTSTFAIRERQMLSMKERDDDPL